MEFYTNVVQHRNKIYHIGYGPTGKFVREDPYQPYLAIDARSPERATHRTIYDAPAELKYFDSIRERKDYISSYEEMFPIYDNISPSYQFLNQRYPTSVEYDASKITILAWDIEVISDDGFPLPEEAKHPVTSIVLKDIKKKNIFVLSLAKFHEQQMDIKVDGRIFYKWCSSEEQLLTKFVLLLETLKPDIMSGWYCENFDVPYIINRVLSVLGPDVAKRMSPLGIAPSSSFKEVEKNGKVEKIFNNNIPGISFLDYRKMYRKYSPGEKESFSLGAIAELELGSDKVDYNEYDNLQELYEFNPQKFVEYNMYDVELIDMLDRKFRYFDLQMSLAYRAKCLYEDVFSPVKTWDCYIYSYLHEKGVVVPPVSREDEGEYTGAYVVEPTPGIYKWVMSYDFNSLYPHCIMMWNLSPETIVDDDFIQVNQKTIDDRFVRRKFDFSNEKHIVSGSGFKFLKNKRGFLSVLMETVYNERVIAKEKMIQLKREYEIEKRDELKNEIARLSTIEQSLKIFINSAYGASANKNFRYYDIRLASSITLSAQLALKWMINKMDSYFVERNIHDTVVYGDTDSTYLTFEKIIPPNLTKEETIDWLDNYDKTELSHYITDCCQELADYLNCNENKLYMKRENICEVGAWQGKKRYAMMIWDSEGVRFKEPKLKVKGIEIVRSSTPAVVKEYLKQTVRLMLLSPEKAKDYVADAKKKFFKHTPEEVAFPRSANNLRKWRDDVKICKKGTPIAVRGVLVHNAAIETLERMKDVNPIMEGEKIKFLYIRTPNEFFNHNVVSFIRKFPAKRELVDYETQFEKTFMSVVEKIGGAFGVDVKPKCENDLSDLFA